MVVEPRRILVWTTVAAALAGALLLADETDNLRSLVGDVMRHRPALVVRPEGAPQRVGPATQTRRGASAASGAPAR